MKSGSDWRALGLVVFALLVFGMLNDKTERIAIWAAGIIAGTIFLKKFGEVINK